MRGEECVHTTPPYRQRIERQMVYADGRLRCLAGLHFTPTPTKITIITKQLACAAAVVEKPRDAPDPWPNVAYRLKTQLIRATLGTRQ